MMLLGPAMLPGFATLLLRLAILQPGPARPCNAAAWAAAGPAMLLPGPAMLLPGPAMLLPGPAMLLLGPAMLPGPAMLVPGPANDKEFCR